MNRNRSGAFESQYLSSRLRGIIYNFSHVVVFSHRDKVFIFEHNVIDNTQSEAKEHSDARIE